MLKGLAESGKGYADNLPEISKTMVHLDNLADSTGIEIVDIIDTSVLHKCSVQTRLRVMIPKMFSVRV